MILVNGDSWTGGPTYEKLNDTWPYQMAEKYQLPIENLACSGASNQRIFRTTIEYLYKCNQPISHLIIGWSSFDRFEFPTTSGFYARITSLGVGFFMETGAPIPNIKQLEKIYYGQMYNETLVYNSFLNNLLVLQDLCSYKNIKLLNFNSFQPRPQLINDSRCIKPTWILPPDTSMGCYLDSLGFERTPSYHTTVEGQTTWANYVYKHL
jgi:hypothetical protein